MTGGLDGAAAERVGLAEPLEKKPPPPPDLDELPPLLPDIKLQIGYAYFHLHLIWALLLS